MKYLERVSETPSPPSSQLQVPTAHSQPWQSDLPLPELTSNVASVAGPDEGLPERVCIPE